MDRELRETFDRDGVVRVAGVVGSDTLPAMRLRLLDRIEELDFHEVAGALRPARGTELALWDVGQQIEFAGLPSALATAVERVFGRGVWAQAEGEAGGVAMPNLPCPSATPAACAEAWHVDEPTPPGGVPSRVLLGYAFLDRVTPGGGGTVVLAGSHRRLEVLADQLAAPATTEAALAALARTEPWLADLFDGKGPTPPDGCVSEGIPLEIQEMTGSPGDIVLMNPRCLHTISANASPRPRLVMRMTCIGVQV